ncbi:MAG: anti-sigma factor [Flavobacteriales bacterium]|nr:anti-sigma factor [Flavobacteriales bacterium]PIY12165.1 MAG: anti-sigma factor [Flavobacteriaceae bacterium CG_4_10_14_3_um_filter_33_47]PJB18271.1 MAG: anti-sigma factor [Flavobacteriaceae bacterium CG_4_9_14_3_um_filter_33_16]
MDIKKYTDSGILELYVAGSLSEEESKEVHNLILKHPELAEEVSNIENAIVKLTASASPGILNSDFNTIKEQLHLSNDGPKLISINQKARSNWFAYTGWAAAILFASGFLWLTNQNNGLKNEITTVETRNNFLEFQIEKDNNSLVEAKTLMAVLRDNNILKIPLSGQTIYPEAYANVYWDKANNNIYLDVQGLPVAPEGKVYQVWSLTLNPLTPTSLGTLDNFNTDENKIFTIVNANASEAFGITLEPAGGSESPTLEQLYTLGTVSAAS